MNWATWHDFWAMGGYAGYVWGSFGATAVGIGVELLGLRARRRAALGALSRNPQRRSA